MILIEQLKAVVYHLVAGQIFGLLFSFLSLCCMSFSSLFRGILYTFFSLLYTALFYYGLYQINGGVTHFYLAVIFFSGFYLYYHFFYELLLPFFFMVKRFFRPIKIKLSFAKKKICVIMEQQREKRRRLKLKNEQRKKKQKNEKA